MPFKNFKYEQNLNNKNNLFKRKTELLCVSCELNTFVNFCFEK